LQIDNAFDAFITQIIKAVSKLVEERTGRVFLAPDPDVDETRYYDGNGLIRLPIDDIRELTSVVVGGETLTVDEDFYLYPLNATAKGKPYEWLELIQEVSGNNRNPRSNWHYVFEPIQRNVAVTGKFGYSATVPEPIKVACLKLAGAIIKENIGVTDLKEISSESLGEYSVSYVKVTDVANRQDFDQVLAPYVRVPISLKKPMSGIIQAS
jgi:hypothetical protein